MKIFKEVTLADSFTVLNALFGFSAITHVLMYGIRLESYIFFYLSAFADGVDGFIARSTEKSPFGKELDSLADSISFAVFPAVLLVKHDPNLFPFSALLVSFSILRLARFNVVEFKDFYGLPTVANALLITSLVRLEVGYGIISLAVLVFSILMVSDIVYPKVRDAIALAVVAIVIISSIVFSEMCFAILILVGIYAFYPILREVIEKWRERKLKKLLSRQE